MSTSTSAKPQERIKFTSLKQLVKLNLEKKKLDLMKDSIFESLVSVTYDRESSAILVYKLLNIYDPVKRVFQLNNNICLSFCKKEVAKVLGMNDGGINFAIYEKTCPKLSEFPGHLKVLKEKFAAENKDDDTENKDDDTKKKFKITLSNIKDILKNMTVDDEESKVQFKQLMTYFLIEGMLRCGSNSKKPRLKTWGLVTNLEECWKVNWAEEVDNYLHFSLRTCKEKLKSKPDKEHIFMGATPVLEAIIYERIPKLRPGTCSAISPPIQKYESTRKEVDNVLRDLETNDVSNPEVEMCPHCTLPVENTPDSRSPLAAENSPESVSLGDQFRGLSLSCGAGDVGTSDSLSGPSANLPFGDASVGESGELVHQGLPNVVDRSEELVLYDDAEVERLNLKCEKWELVKKASPPSDSARSVELGENLVGKRIKVWWAADNSYRQGVVKSFDCSIKKHKVSFDGGDEKLLKLKVERWELVENVSPILASVGVAVPGKVSSSQFDMICVQGYKVKNINAPILKAIFRSHGDIAAKCVFTDAAVRTSLLEAVCDIVRRIKTNDVSKMEELESQLSAAKASEINVSWLQAHLETFRKRNDAQKKVTSLMEMKTNTILAKRAARIDQKDKYDNFMVAHNQLEEAKRCVKVLELVEKKLSNDILEFTAEKDLFVGQPILYTD